MAGLRNRSPPCIPKSSRCLHARRLSTLPCLHNSRISGRCGRPIGKHTKNDKPGKTIRRRRRGRRRVGIKADCVKVFAQQNWTNADHVKKLAVGDPEWVLRLQITDFQTKIISPSITINNHRIDDRQEQKAVSAE